MKKLKKILIYILLVTTFYSGMVFAWDTDPEALVGHDSELIQLLSTDDDSLLNPSLIDPSLVDSSLVENVAPDEEKHLNDHCCHGISHLVALMDHSYIKFTDNSVQEFHISQYPIKYYFQTLLLRPPIRVNA